MGGQPIPTLVFPPQSHLSPPSTSWSNSRRPISPLSRSSLCRRRREKAPAAAHTTASRFCTSFSTKWKEGYSGSKVKEGPLNIVAPLDLLWPASSLGSTGRARRAAKSAQQEEHEASPGALPPSSSSTSGQEEVARHCAHRPHRPP
jgi:hypothetical protein